MKHIKLFEAHRSIFDEQIWQVDKAREVLSKVYNIEDEVKLSANLTDFLVYIDEFMDIMEKHNGHIAGNAFHTTNEIKDALSTLERFGISPVIFIAPFWLTRSESRILNFEDVYADTVYIQLIDSVRQDDIEKIYNELKVDEVFVVKSESGKDYLRIWWD